MNIEECFQKGLLKIDKKDLEKAKRSIETAKHMLELAKRTFEAEIYENSISDAYAAMFHAARALLFKDGVKERSHFAIYAYIKEKYYDKLELRFINELNSLRLQRHELQYGLEPVEINKSEVEDIIKIAEDFIKAIERLI